MPPTTLDAPKVPQVQYTWGDTDTCALTIDRWPYHRRWPRRYQVRTWADGDTTDLEYLRTFEEAIAYGRQSMGEDYARIHGLASTAGIYVVGMAPVWTTDAIGGYWTWVPVTPQEADRWWEEHECPAGEERPVIQFLPDHEHQIG